MTDIDPTEEAAIDANTAAIQDAVNILRRDAHERRRANIVLIIASSVAALVLLALVAFSVLILNAANQSEENGRQIKEVLTIVDPNSQRGREAAKQQRDTVNTLLTETDCRTRRALAGLPAPEEGTKCVPPTTTTTVQP